MSEDDKGQVDRLPHGGLEVLTSFITHQDTVIWSSLSIFVAAELLLLALWFQILSDPTLTLHRARDVATVGILLTIASGLILWRANAYIEEYYRIAKSRAAKEDLEIFDIKLKSTIFKLKGHPVDFPRAFWILVFVHLSFLALWIALLARSLG